MSQIVKFLSLILLSIIIQLSVKTVSAAPPANFQSTLVWGTDLEGPSGFEFAPDGRVFVLERTGKVKVIKNGTLLETPFTELQTIATGDRGLIGIAFDPDFAQNHFVYFYYTALDKLNYLVRFNASADTATDGPVILYHTTFPSEQLHVGGSIRFGLDGKLYFAVGDNGYPPNAQELSNPHGKIMRINKDGTIPQDNPFVNTPNALPEIWAYGFRNPWRFQFDSLSGRMFGGDVGDYSIEEVNHIQKGGNYGWPLCEGVCQNQLFTNPIFDYPHLNDSAAATGGPVYRGSMFPADYYGRLFFADYAMGFIKTIKLDENGNSLGVSDFDLNAGSVVDLKISPVDSSMYYLTYIPGRLYKVIYSEGNSYPVPDAKADVLKGVDPLTVNFSSAGSSDPDGDQLQFEWDFGDGSKSNLANPTKIYTQKGTYTVQLSVSDGTNTSLAIPLTIQVGIPPTVTIAVPQEGFTYKAGDNVSYQMFATDGAGFDINDGAIITDVVLHHGTHIHPFVSGLVGRANSFTIPATGEASDDTWFEIQVRVTDTNGLTTAKSVNIYPQKSGFNLLSNVPGLTVLLDGVPHQTPNLVAGVVGFLREVSAPMVQELNGIYYAFIGWSDGSSPRHFVQVQPQETTLNAQFKVANSFNAQYFKNPGLAGTPVVQRTEPVIDFNWDLSSPDAQLPNDGFSARWVKSEDFVQGTYKFSATGDDGLRLFIDGLLVIDKWIDQASTTYTATVDLNSGSHQIMMEYYEAGGGAQAKLVWEPVLNPATPTPLPTPGTDSFAAQYFDNPNLTGPVKLNRQDQSINFVWNEGSPDILIPADKFSARWTRKITTQAGEYEFTATADDGVRVLVDGVPLIDKWIDQPSTKYTATGQLTAGEHELIIEYYENYGGAVMIFDYKKLADTPPAAGYLAKFWNTPGTGEFPPMPTTEPVLTRTDQLIDFTWDIGSPDPAVSPDHFVATWEAVKAFEGGNYKFSTVSDDGIRVFIDGQLIFDEWNDHAEEFVFHKAITSGNHLIKVEYYENDGGAGIKFGFEKVDVIPPFYTAEFFNNPTLTGPAAVTRSDEVLYYVWAGNSPDPKIQTDNFSGRWTKTDTFDAGIYQFTLFGDDGMRLFIDGILEMDAWTDQSEKVNNKQIALTGGTHQIKVEYYENTGGAYAKMLYKRTGDLPPGPTPTPTPTPAPITGFKGEYWNQPQFIYPVTMPQTAPDLIRDDSLINFEWNNASPDPKITPDKFIARWSKKADFEQGTYSFNTESDDGIRVYIDNGLIIDEWNDHAKKVNTAQIQLNAGEHDIRIEYYENGGGAIAKFNYQKVASQQLNFKGEYFDNQNLTGLPKLTREDEQINFRWEFESPGPEIPKDFFSVRWTKQKQFAAGVYKFTLKSDDGIRFWIDNNLLVDDWTDHSLKTYTPTVNLTEGTHVIKIEYYDKNNNAIVIFIE